MKKYLLLPTMKVSQAQKCESWRREGLLGKEQDFQSLILENLREMAGSET